MLNLLLHALEVPVVAKLIAVGRPLVINRRQVLPAEVVEVKHLQVVPAEAGVETAKQGPEELTSIYKRIYILPQVDCQLFGAVFFLSNHLLVL